MEVDKHLTCDAAESDGDVTLVLEVSVKDPFFNKKKKLLEDMGFDLNGCVCIKASSGPDELKSILYVMLQRARITCLDEVEIYFSGLDVCNLVDLNSPRNELEALHMIITRIDETLSTTNCIKTNILEKLRDLTINMIDKFGTNIKDETKVISDVSCKREKALLLWAENNGLQTKLEISYVERAGRGAIARENLKVGDVALEIPLSLIISETLVHESDMFPVLETVNGMSLETMLLLWSMKEKHNQSSRFKLYFDTLPDAFNTGLSFEVDAVMALDGTPLLEEIVQAKEHLRLQYDELFPALCNDYPNIFPPELYTWKQFLWACELWYSNSMKIMFPDGKLRTCLIPVAGFLNHSPYPHITHYGKVDAATNSLKFPLSRPCNAGQQCFLSYGNFSSSHLITFYGFLPQGDNPYDVITLDLDTASEEEYENGESVTDWPMHMVRGTWFAKNQGIFQYGLPPPLLDHLRRARGTELVTESQTPENLRNEIEILRDLCSTFEGMMELLGDAEIDDRDRTRWDVKLALDFKNSYRRIIASIISSCNAGYELLEKELRQNVASPLFNAELNNQSM